MKLTCYLLRASATPAESLRDTDARVSFFVKSGGEWSEQESLASLQGVDAAAVLYRTTAQSRPPWQALVSSWEEAVSGSESDFALDDRPDRGAVFFFKAGDPPRWLAWTFGRGYRYLDYMAVEPRFGVICALNELGRADREVALRKLQVRRSAGFNQMVGRSTFEDAPVSAFELDEIWDAIRSVGGRSPEGGSVYGSISLVRSARIDTPDELQALSSRNLVLFQQDAYKVQFSFLDNYIPITDIALEADLDRHLSGLLTKSNVAAAFSYPSPIASFGSRDSVVEVLFPRELVGNGRIEMTIRVVASHEGLKTQGQVDLETELRFVGDDDVIGRYRLKECLVAQFEYKGSTYVLEEGVYYEVDVDFLKELDAFVTSRIRKLDVAAYRAGTTEDRWLDSAAKQGQFLKVHPAKFNPPTAGTVELADMVTSDAMLLHVKRGAGAPEVGAVARQVVSAADSLLLYPDAVEWLRDRCAHVPELYERISEAGSRPRLGIVLLGAEGEVEKLSLFAKMELRRAFKRLEAMRFEANIFFVPSVC